MEIHKFIFGSNEGYNNPCQDKFSIRVIRRDKYGLNRKFVIYKKDSKGNIGEIAIFCESEKEYLEKLRNMFRYFKERFDDWKEYLDTGVYPIDTTELDFCDMWVYKEIIKKSDMIPNIE